MAAGSHSSAAVTGDGRLFMSGRLMDSHHAEGLARRYPTEGPLGEEVHWGWAGFGGSQMAAVQGLAGVRDAALGGWHALALTD